MRPPHERAVVVETLRRLVNLPPQQRQVLLVRYGGATVEEASRVLGWARENVREQESLGLRSLLSA